MTDLVIKTCKRVVTNMLKILKKYISIMRREIKTISELQELKNTISKIKIQQVGRSDTTEKKISKFKNITLDMIKSEVQSNKMLRTIPRE